MDLDDFGNTCGLGRYPLINEVRDVLIKDQIPVTMSPRTSKPDAKGIFDGHQFYSCRKTKVARLPWKNKLPATTLLIKLYTHIILYRALISTCENRSRKFRCDRKPNYHKITSTADHNSLTTYSNKDMKTRY